MLSTMPAICTLKCAQCLEANLLSQYGLLPSGHGDPWCRQCREKHGPPGMIRLTCVFCGKNFFLARDSHRKNRKAGRPSGCGECYSSYIGRGQKIRMLYTPAGKWDGRDQAAITAKKCRGCSVIRPLLEYAKQKDCLLGLAPRCISCTTEEIRCSVCGDMKTRLRNAKAALVHTCKSCVMAAAEARRSAGKEWVAAQYAIYRNKDGAEMIDINSLVGQEFSALTVLGEGPRIGVVGYRSLHCRCRCGVEVDRILYHVTGRSIRDCGCKYDFGLDKQSDIIGKRYGKLTIIAVGPLLSPKGRVIPDGVTHSRKRERYRTMSCVCDCGVEKNINFNSLLVGTSRSCGCSRKLGQIGVPEGKRRCATCKEIKDVSIFASSMGGGRTSLSSWCPECSQSYQVWSRLRAKYGLTREDVLNMGRAQEWRCAICNRELQDKNAVATLGKGHAKTAPHIDHEHVENVENPGREHIRGILCTGCNSGIAFFKDSIENMRKAILYLESYALKKATFLAHNNGPF